MSAVNCGLCFQKLPMLAFNVFNIKYTCNCMMKCFLAGESKGLKCYGSVGEL